jgi:sulfide:quinone oxidoreductase
MHSISGETLDAKFDGHANCFIESGHGKAFLIDFNYEHEPMTGTFPFPFVGPFSLLKESKINHLGKLLFKWTYWNLLLQGREMPMGPNMSFMGKDIEENFEAKPVTN